MAIRKSVQRRGVQAMASNQLSGFATMAHEKTRADKPEMASPLVAKPTFRNRLNGVVRSIGRFFARLFGRRGYSPAIQPKAEPRKVKQTPPRAFGGSNAGSKLKRKMAKYASAH